MQSKFRFVPLSEILERVTRPIRIADHKEYRNVGVKWYGLGTFVRESKAGMSIATKKQYIIKSGDVVFNKLFAWKGSFAVAKNVDGCIVSGEFPIFRYNENLIDGKYLQYYFRTQHIARQAAYSSKGAASVSRLRLHPNDFLKITIPLPPLADQERISERISELYGRLKKIDELRVTARAELQNLMIAALRQALPAREDRAWKTVKLGELAEYINGRAFKTHEWEDYGKPIVRIQNLRDPSAPFNYSTTKVKEKYCIDNGDLLLSWSASLDAFIWNGGEAILNQHIFKVEPMEGMVRKRFLYHLLKHALHGIRQMTHGSTMKHITKGKFVNYAVSIPYLGNKPDLGRQDIIASYLDKIALSCKHVLSLYEKMEIALVTMNEAILDKAFRGVL